MASLEYFYYNEDQKRKYRKFIKSLWDSFKEAATNEGMDQKRQQKILDNAYPLILKDLKENETKWEKRFRNLLSEKIIWLLEFEYFLW
ncbi:RAD protein (Pv-fam-e), partial [Plasmodium vivax India VII]